LTPAPATIAAWSTIFRERFADVAALLSEAGVSWFISSQGGGELAASPAPGAATLIISSHPDRRFGVIMSESSLKGMRSHRYDIGDEASPERNEAFVAELKRRINSQGATRGEIFDGDHSMQHWKCRYRRPPKRTATWHGDAF
jgi:hypothetical protein